MTPSSRNTTLRFTQEMLKLLGRVHVGMPWKSLPHYLEMVLQYQLKVELGFGAVELEEASRHDLKAVARQLQEKNCGISLHGPFWDLAPGSVDPLMRQISRFRIQQFFDVVDIFSPLQVVCHTGYDPTHHIGDQERWLEQSLRFWEPFVLRAERLGIPLLLENVWEHDPGFHSRLFEQLDSPHFGFCLDVGHQHSFSRASLTDWLEALSGVFKEIHLHDNDGTHDTHLPVGQGTIDFVSLFGFIGSKGLRPQLTIEPHQEEHITQSLEGLMRVIDTN